MSLFLQLETVMGMLWARIRVYEKGNCQSDKKISRVDEDGLTYCTLEDLVASNVSNDL